MLTGLFIIVEAENHLNPPQLNFFSKIFNMIGKFSPKKVWLEKIMIELEIEHDMDGLRYI